MEQFSQKGKTKEGDLVLQFTYTCILIMYDNKTTKSMELLQRREKT